MSIITKYFGAGLLLLLTLCIPQLLRAQDDDVDSLGGMQQTMDNLSAILAGTWQPPDVWVERTRAEDGAFTIGDADAPVTLVAFIDFACPHCQAYRPALSQFVDSFVETGMAKLELRILPTLGGEQTVLAGHAAECADDQTPGAFWQARDLLYVYATSSRYDSSMPERLAEDLGLNLDALLACMETADQVERDVALAHALGVSGTPVVLVRYGDAIMRYIQVEGQTYRTGGPHFGILSAAVQRGQYR